MKQDKTELIGIVGSGRIGMSMAVLFTGNGYRVTVYGVDKKETEQGLKLYREYYEDLIKHQLVTKRQAEICEEKLTMATSYDDLAEADFLLECVFENIEVKRGVYSEIEKFCKKFKAIASTTSAISPDDLAKDIKNKERFCIAHPWNPPHLTPTIEVVKGENTSEETTEFVVDLFKAVGREAVVLQKSVPGFIFNRLHHALFREAVYLAENGIAAPEDIDKILMTSIMPRYSSVGLFQYQDYTGLDLVKSIQDYLYKALSDAGHSQDFINGLIEQGDLGYKTGKGMLDWSETDIDEFRENISRPFYAFFNWDLPEVE